MIDPQKFPYPDCVRELISPPNLHVLQQYYHHFTDGETEK